MIKLILTYLAKKQLIIQSNLLWILAIFNLVGDNKTYFWLFAIPAIIFGGMQDILDELRNLNSKSNTTEHES